MNDLWCWWDIQVGENDPYSVSSINDWCYVRVSPTGQGCENWVCSRPTGHPGVHVGATGPNTRASYVLQDRDALPEGF